jgi:glycosyltransferase involved in cell wall biosynthesis
VIPHEKRPGDSAFTSYFIKAIDGFITMSEKVLLDLRSLTSTKAQAVSHPLYDNFGDKIEPQIARDYLHLDTTKKIVLFFGFIRKYKGLDLLLDAIALLKQENYFATNPTTFLIAGEFYEDQQPYLDQIERLGIQDHLVLRHEFITDSEVKYYLSAADCVIQPYKSATQSGVTPLAYHFEIPMIVTNVGGLPALVPPTVGLVCEPNPQAIAESVAHFFHLDSTSFQQHIREEKKKYSWQNICHAILSLAEKP